MPHPDPRSTGQWLAHHARANPSSVAFANGDTYRAFALNVLRAMDALSAIGIERGQVVGVETDDRYLHLLILIAAEALAFTTISLVPAELLPPANLGRLCDWVLISRPLETSDPTRTVVMTVDWIENLLARKIDERRLDALDREVEPETLVRLVKSSGTTGVPKVMGMTHAMLRLIIRNNVRDLPDRITRRLNYVCLYHFTVRAAYWRALLTLQVGGTIHLIGSDVLWDVIRTGTGNYVSFVTGDLARFIQTIPDGRGPFDVRTEVHGAAVSAQLRREVRRKLSNDLSVTYSSNEVQRISRVDDDGVGVLFPEVRVRIVDERGEPVALGQPGMIQVKTDTMTDGYIGAPDLTRSAFIDGWYHTSDFGYQPSERTLVVLGRADDMVNAGGVKIAPGPIEERLKAIDGIHDALVTSIDENLEAGVLLVGVEVGPHGAAGLRPLIRQIVGEYTNEFRLLAVPEFPRTETAKIRREDVRELYRRTRGAMDLDRRMSEPNHPIVGTWRLTRFTEENLVTGAVTFPLGPRPKAYVIYTADGYVSTIFTATDRAGPVAGQATEAEAVGLYRSMVAFAGRYVLMGESLIYHPEISWNEAWNGTSQERLFAIEGDRLEVRSVPVVSTLTGAKTVFSLTWDRAR